MVQGAAAVGMDPAIASAMNFMSRTSNFSAAQDAAQPMVNQTALSRVSDNSVADGVRASLAHLIDSERRTRPMAVSGEDSGATIRVIGEEQATAGSGDAGQANDQSLRGLKDAFEYATNAALVSLVLNGVSNGITTLTARGG